MTNLYCFKLPYRHDTNVAIIAANSKYEAMGFVQTIKDEQGYRKYYFDEEDCKIISNASYIGKDFPKLIDIYELFKERENKVEEETLRIIEERKQKQTNSGN